MKKIAIIIPVFNAEKYLRQCLDSILAQSFADFVVWLIDDGSDDASQEICRAYERQHDNVRLFTSEHQGAAGVRNQGLERALDDAAITHVAFVDSDDALDSRYLASLVSGLEMGAQVAVVRGRTVKEDEAVSAFAGSVTTRLVRPGAYWRRCEECNACWGKLFDKRLLEDVRFPVGIPFEDEYFTYRVLFGQSRIAFVDAPLYDYIQHPNSVIRAAGNTKRQIVSQTVACWRQLCCFAAHGEFICCCQNALRILKNVVKLAIHKYRD